jgi:hypothetical protein
MQEKQKGMVGINVYSFGLYPFSNSAADKNAVQRFRDFFIGWYVTSVFWFMEIFVKYFHLSYLCDYLDPFDFVIIQKNLASCSNFKDEQSVHLSWHCVPHWKNVTLNSLFYSCLHFMFCLTPT